MTDARDRGPVLHEIFAVLWLWVKAQFVIWASTTALYLAGFFIARTPVWALLAVLCGLASIIPHIGPGIGLLLVLMVSFLGSGGEMTAMVAALAVWVVVQLVEGFVIGPRVLGRQLGLSPWLVIAGGLVGALLGGPIGLLVATPILAVAAVIWRRIHDHV